jgi:hypothetical protein
MWRSLGNGFVLRTACETDMQNISGAVKFSLGCKDTIGAA